MEGFVLTVILAIAAGLIREFGEIERSAEEQGKEEIVSEGIG